MHVNTAAFDLLVHHSNVHHRQHLALDWAELLLQLRAAVIQPGLLSTHAAVVNVCRAAGKELRRRALPVVVAIIVAAREIVQHVVEEVAQTQLPKKRSIAKAIHCLEQLDASQDVTVANVRTLET